MSKGNIINKINKWSIHIPEDDILKMEDYLGKIMSPVRPRDGFIRDLHEGLTQSETKASQPEDLGFLGKLFWIGAGFASAIVFLMVGIRVIVNLIRGSNLRDLKRIKKVKPIS